MIKITPIFSFEKEPFSSAKVRARVLNELKRQAKIAKSQLEQTTEYWNTRVAFIYRISYKNASPILTVEPDEIATPTGADHWKKVNYGTDVRYVVMSEDFVAKTQYPGKIGGNVPGEGGPAYIDPNGRPGILPRRWDALIQNGMRTDFTFDIQEAIRKGMEKK